MKTTDIFSPEVIKELCETMDYMAKKLRARYSPDELPDNMVHYLVATRVAYQLDAEGEPGLDEVESNG